MNIYLQFFVTIPFIVFVCQLYQWVVSLKGTVRQRHCRGLGITYTSAGTVCFLFRSFPLTLLGLLLLMLGLRLIAHGLDRIDKSIFIDRFDEDQ